MIFPEPYCGPWFPYELDHWHSVLDYQFYDFCGISSYDLPIPKSTWMVWYKAGYSANFVASVLANYIQEIDFTRA